MLKMFNLTGIQLIPLSSTIMYYIINDIRYTYKYIYDAHITSSFIASYALPWWKYSMLCDINHLRQSTSNVSLLLSIDANCKKYPTSDTKRIHINMLCYKLASYQYMLIWDSKYYYCNHHLHLYYMAYLTMIPQWYITGHNDTYGLQSTYFLYYTTLMHATYIPHYNY